MKTRAVAPADWPLIEDLFGDNGACGGCWCMYWRVPSTGKLWDKVKGGPNRAAFKALIESGAARGCLAFDGDRPVGWASIGPRQDFPYLARSRALPRDAPAGTWSVTCFFIASDMRGKGVATALLDAAVSLASGAGARRIEGYPVTPKKAGRIPAAFAHTGVPQLFVRAGFSKSHDGGGRAVYARDL